MFTLLLFVLLVAAVALLWNEGLWANGITLINVTLAALIAFNFFEPLADLFESYENTYTYFWDFLALWALFCVSLLTLRTTTDALTKVKIRFIPPVEHAGRILVGVWAAWIFLSFTAATVHTAPLAVDPFGGSFDTAPDEGLFFGTAPDRQWLAFIQARSQGSLGWEDEQPASQEYAAVDGNVRVFDPRGEFIVKYRTRRAHLEESYKKDLSPRVRR